MFFLSVCVSKSNTHEELCRLWHKAKYWTNSHLDGWWSWMKSYAWLHHGYLSRPSLVSILLKVLYTSWEHTHVLWSSQVTDLDKSILGERHYIINGSHTDPIHSFSPLCVLLMSWIKGHALMPQSRMLKTPLWEYFVPTCVCVCHVCSLTDRCRAITRGAKCHCLSPIQPLWQHKVKRVKTSKHDSVCVTRKVLLCSCCWQYMKIYLFSFFLQTFNVVLYRL